MFAFRATVGIVVKRTEIGSSLTAHTSALLSKNVRWCLLTATRGWRALPAERRRQI